MTKIKICGMRRLCDIEYANRLLPDYVGYVFWDKSKRYVQEQEARNFTQNLDKRIVPVGVFVDEDIEKVAYLLNENIIHIAQLHGNEDEEYVEKLRSKINTGRENKAHKQRDVKENEKMIIKAFKVRDSKVDEIATNFNSDMILFDNGYGTGKCFDWNLIKNVKRPFFIAGGMDEKNVDDVIKNINPYAVDISSNIETDGYKDFEKMKRFIAAVKEADI